MTMNHLVMSQLGMCNILRVYQELIQLRMGSLMLLGLEQLVEQLEQLGQEWHILFLKHLGLIQVGTIHTNRCC